MYVSPGELYGVENDEVGTGDIDDQRISDGKGKRRSESIIQVSNQKMKVEGRSNVKMGVAQSRK